MSRETLFAVGGLGGVVVAAALVGYLLGPQVGLGVGALGAVAVAIGIGLYRHIRHLHDQQEALEQQVEQQQEKTTTYRRQFEQTQNQLEEVKAEISTSTEDSSQSATEQSSGTSSSPTDESGQAAESEPTSARDVAESAAAMGQSSGTRESSSPPPRTDGSAEPEPPADNPPAETTARAQAGPPSLATVVEQSWQSVETHSVVLEIIDSKPLEADPEQVRSALRDLIRTVVAGQANDGQVFTSRAITLRAQHRNPQSDVTIESDGGYTPARDAPDRRVVRVGTTENGIYVDCTTTLADSQQEARLEAVQKQLRTCGWSLSVSRHTGGHRIEIDQTGARKRRPA